MTKGVRGVTDEQLSGLARAVANMAKNDLRNTGNCNGVLASVHDGQVHRMRTVEAVVADKFGVNWLNNSAAKDAVFRTLAMASVSSRGRGVEPAEGMGFASVVNAFPQTPKFTALPFDEAVRLKNELSTEELQQQGYVDPPHDCVMATVQTPERVCMFVQRYDPRERMFIGEPHVSFVAQEDVSGRVKFFGVEGLAPDTGAISDPAQTDPPAKG